MKAKNNLTDHKLHKHNVNFASEKMRVNKKEGLRLKNKSSAIEHKKICD